MRYGWKRDASGRGNAPGWWLELRAWILFFILCAFWAGLGLGEWLLAASYVGIFVALAYLE